MIMSIFIQTLTISPLNAVTVHWPLSPYYCDQVTMANPCKYLHSNKDALHFYRAENVHYLKYTNSPIHHSCLVMQILF